MFFSPVRELANKYLEGKTKNRVNKEVDTFASKVKHALKFIRFTNIANLMRFSLSKCHSPHWG